MKKREWAVLTFMAMAAVSALLIGIGKIYVIGIDGDRLREPETLGLLAETADGRAATEAGSCALRDVCHIGP